MDGADSVQHKLEGVASARRHPLLSSWPELAGFAERADIWTAEALEQLRLRAVVAHGRPRPRVHAQDATLLADGLHYEVRIAERGVLATRERNAHDFFNALIWLRHPWIKQALNARQVADIAAVGPKQRTRGQCALTHFDEAGAIVWLADPSLLDSWDRHDWTGLFLDRRGSWGTAIAVTVFGHALLEHVWNGHDLPVAKALVVAVPPVELSGVERQFSDAIVRTWPGMEASVADAIASGDLLQDPQELRPLPLAGIRGWHAGNMAPVFFHETPCFRPLRPGRRYPSAWAGPHPPTLP